MKACSSLWKLPWFQGLSLQPAPDTFRIHPCLAATVPRYQALSKIPLGKQGQEVTTHAVDDGKPIVGRNTKGDVCVVWSTQVESSLLFWAASIVNISGNLHMIKSHGAKEYVVTSYSCCCPRSFGIVIDFGGRASNFVDAILLIYFLSMMLLLMLVMMTTMTILLQYCDGHES